MEITFLPTNTPEIHLHVEQLLLNTGRRPQTSQKSRNYPRTWVGQKKKKTQRQKNRDRTCTSWRELWRRKGFHTLGSPFTGGDGWQGESFGATEESTAIGVQRAKRRDSRTQMIGADQHSPAWEACLLTCWSRWGLGAEVWALEVRSQGEDWGWLHEHSLKGASAPQLAGKEFRKKSGTA